MSTLNLHTLFNPDAVTVIGASEKTDSVGTFIMKNLINGGFKGSIFPVNPEYKEVMGFPCFPDVAAVQKWIEPDSSKADTSQTRTGEGQHQISSTTNFPPVNIAIIATPIITVPKMVEECGLGSISGAVIVSSEGAVPSGKGNKIPGKPEQNIISEIMNVAKRYNLRILGYNSLGIINTPKSLNASCSYIAPLPGKIAFICQSPTVSNYVLDLSVRENIGLSHFISLGSMVDVDFADMIDYLGSLHSVDSILMYVESLTNIRSFMSAARSVSRVKPIIAVKSGKTAALADQDSLYDAAFRRAGILRVNDFQEMFDCAQFISRQKKPKGSKLTIITNSEGAGTMAVDTLGYYGMEPSGLSESIIEQIDQFLPVTWSKKNPVNLPPADASDEIYLKTVQVCADAHETDALLLLPCPTTTLDPEQLSQSVGEYLKTAKCPVFTAWMGGGYKEEALSSEKEETNTGRHFIDKVNGVLRQAGVITYDTPERGVRAFANLCRYYRNIEILQQIPVRRDQRLVIDQQEAKAIIEGALGEKERAVLTDMEANALMQAYGIPMNRTELAVSLEETISIAREIGYPVMLRICSRDIPHKSAAGGAILNLNTWQDVEFAFKTIMENGKKYAPQSHIMGVIVQPMITKADYELMMVSTLDRNFGPVIRFGMGGAISDIFRDMAATLPPLDNLLARRFMEDTRIARLFKGERHIKPVNSEIVEDMLIRLSRMVTDFPEIEELKINPIMISNGEPVVTGVEAVVKRSKVTPPMHLVIGSYPFEYETEDETIDHEKIFIRPIKPSDAPLMVQHFLALSSRSVYFRFFTPLKQLSQSMLIRLTQIDYDREIALVALIGDGDEQVMAGVARVIFEPDGKGGEFSVVLADKWHGKGIGASLLKRCLKFSAQKGLERVWGIVLAENRQMLNLAKKLGFKVKYISGSSEYELEIDLAGINF